MVLRVTAYQGNLAAVPVNAVLLKLMLQVRPAERLAD